MRTRDLLLFLLVVFLWGVNWSVMKIGLSFVSPDTYVLHRFVVSAIVLAPLVVITKKRIPKDSRTIYSLVFLCFIYVLSFIATHAGTAQETSGMGAVLTFTYPLFVFFLAPPILKERITFVKSVGAAIGFVGVMVLFLGRMGSMTITPTLLLILGAFVFAVQNVYYKGYLSHVDPLITCFSEYLLGAFLLSLWSLFAGGFTVPSQPTYWYMVFISAIGATVIGYTVWLTLLRKADAIALTGSAFLVPVVGLISGWLILGESVSMWVALGTGLVLAGVFFVNPRVQKIVGSRSRTKHRQHSNSAS